MNSNLNAGQIQPCHPGGGGIIFPAIEEEQYWNKPLRAILYAVAMLYLFLGVNIAADKFMSAIEMIRSKKLRVRVKETGSLITVTMWNPTVANLTLLAVGSSAPEIMLSIVEIIRNGFFAGDLGPSTIIGSAAFNLFVIISVCILAVPSTEVRRIKELGVFGITVIFSLFSYLWMLFIVRINSANVIEVWEAAATLALFPVLIFISYLADIGWLSSGTPSQAEVNTGRAPTEVNTGRAPTVVTRHSDIQDAHDDNVTLHDVEGITLKNPAGILSFESDNVTLIQGKEERVVPIPVFRRNGTQGTVACFYSMEPLTAMPDYDYRHEEGHLRYAPGQTSATINLTLLPKNPGERTDSFQVVLTNPQGGASFNPHLDGATVERCLLTVTIRNESETNTVADRALRFVDATVNLDRLRLGSVTWYEDIIDAMFNVSGDGQGGGTTGDLILHIISLPWKLLYSLLVPPPIYCGGWVCFSCSLFHIAILTGGIIEFAELFGCVCQIEDFITAITFVALGTSMPDLFASITAAVQDDSADASIINVTGSNSVNVFLGIGLPWTMASIFWAIVGDNDTWRSRFPGLIHSEWAGHLIVSGDHLAFSVSVFSIAACVCLMIICLRRWAFGGELGGPYRMKLLSFLMLVGLWFWYIGLSVWKAWNKTEFATEVVAICVGVCIYENALLIVGGMTYLIIAWSKNRGAQGPKSPLDLEEIQKIEEPMTNPNGPRGPTSTYPSPLELPDEVDFEHP